MNAVHVAARFDPLHVGAERIFATDAGQTVAELVARCNPPEWFAEVGHVLIRTPDGDAEILKQHWRLVRPKAGTFVAVYALPQGGGRRGGGGGKNVLATVAAIAVIAAATAISGGLLGPAGLGLFGASFAAGGVGATLAGAAVGVVGSLAIRALTPPPIAANNAALSDSAGPDISGQRIAGINGNPIGRGAQLPCIIGTMVASPPLVARPYTSFFAGDTYAHAVVGLWGRHGVSSVQINGVNSSLIPDLELEIREGQQGDARITVAPETVIEDRTIGQLSEFKLDRTNTTTVETPSNPSASYPIWHYATTDGDCDVIKIRVQFPSGLVQNDVATGNQVAIAVPVRIAMRKRGDSAWINLPEVHFRDRDATVKSFTQEIVLTWEERSFGTPITLNSDFLTYRVYGYTGPEVHKWTPHSFFLQSAADYTPINAGLSKDGVKIFLAESTFARGEYEIRIMRGLAYIGADTGASSHPGNLFEASGTTVQVSQRDKVSTMYVETVQTVRRTYPLSTKEPLTIIAVKGRGLQLESISATFTSYAPVWTGAAWSSTASATANPAAIYRRMLIDYNEKTGRLPSAMRDDAGLGAWFDHCAARGYTVNAVLDSGTLQENLQLVAAAGWAVPSFGPKWGVVIERDRSAEAPVQLITPLTGRGLAYNKNFEAIPHAIAAEFNDAAREYKIRDNVFVYRDGYSAANATDYETINYKGITSEAAARARANLDMRQMLYRRTTYKLDIFIEHLMAKRGDLVLLSHDVLSKQYAFARIKSVWKTGSNIVAISTDFNIDAPVGEQDLFSLGNLFGGGVTVRAFQLNAFQSNAFGGGQNDRDLFADGNLSAVAIRLTTGAAVTYAISPPNGGDKLVFEAPVADNGTIAPGCIAAIGARGFSSRRCIVFDVKRNDLETATLTLVDEAPILHQ